MYKALHQLDTSKDWASVKVVAKDFDKYPLDWLNPFLLNPTVEKKFFYGILGFKPNLTHFVYCDYGALWRKGHTNSTTRTYYHGFLDDQEPKQILLGLV